MIAGKTWERDTENIELRSHSRTKGVDVLSPEVMLGSRSDSHNPTGKGLELSYFTEVLFTYSALCVPLSVQI